MTESTQVIAYDPAGNADAVRLFEAAAVLVSKAAEKYTKLVIQAQGDAEVMLEFRARANAVSSELDKVRLAAGDSLRQQLAALNLAFNTRIQALDAIVKNSDAQLLAWDKQQKEAAAAAQRQREEEEARLAAERAAAEQQAADAQVLVATATNDEDRKAAQELVAEAEARTGIIDQRQEVVSTLPALSPPPKSIRGSHGSTGGARDNWTWELIDTPEQPAAESIKLVPEAYLLPPVDRINRGVMTAFARSTKGAVAVPGIKFENKAVISTKVAR